MTAKPRLIERAFPLKQTSLASVHEKNVRHGHISTLHIWPARRPLAACRAALLATLLPDPGTPEERRKLCERIGGTVTEKIERKKMPNGRIIERVKEETQGGVLRWIGTEPKSGGRKKIEEHRRNVEFRENELAWFREEIKKAYGGRAPRVLDPFAGGGAIPLEAMRLGCEATAVDINPVAWFILKCTLEYPQQLAGKTHPLPDFIVEDEDFMEVFYKAHPHLVGRTKQTKRQKAEPQRKLWDKEDSGRIPRADLAWHVRAWGRWVLNQARKELAQFYPTYADFEPIDLKNPNPYEKQPMRLVPLKEDGMPDIDLLNAEFSEDYIKDKRNPRWVAKPTVAYLWARTVKCKHCRATVPLLKTRWLCKKDRKRVLLAVTPKNDKSGVEFGIQNDVPVHGSNPAQRREHDKRIGQGTMSRAGAKCPCCDTIMTMSDIRVEGCAGRLSQRMMAFVVEGQTSKEYKPATETDIEVAVSTGKNTDDLFSGFPDGIFDQDLPRNRIEGNSGFRVILYGIDKWRKLFLDRQLKALGIFVHCIRKSRDLIKKFGYNCSWIDALQSNLSICLDKLVDSSTTITHWQIGGEFSVNTLQRFALPMSWDFSEVNLIGNASGSFRNALNWVTLVNDHLNDALSFAVHPRIYNSSVKKMDIEQEYDVILTDPPYYDSIAYSDVMDLFYNWLRCSVNDMSHETEEAFRNETGPKWENEIEDGELIDDRSRFGGDAVASKKAYENGMSGAFKICFDQLSDSGSLVVVFAHKHPNAWETLVSAIIHAGFFVDASWPIQTERAVRSNALKSASLSSSVWLVCKKRLISARPGWDNKVLEEMRANITERLREYWDAGIRGPDFVWAATGPALEAYSKHPIIKKANTPGQVMSVGEFLSHVRRMVVDFVVGQVLTGEKEGSDMAAADRMDAPTAYYLLHRHDFGLGEAPSGACILYATACGLSDRELETVWDLVSHKGAAKQTQDENDETDSDYDADPEENGHSGSKIKLKAWVQRKRGTMGFEAPSGRPIPLIDRVHRLMHLWRAGDVHKVDEYLDDNGLRRQELFKRLVQSLIELSNGGSDERPILESLSNHIQAKGAVFDPQKELPYSGDDIAE